MRAVWVDEGNGPNWDLLKKHNITWMFVSLRDPDAAKHLAAIKGKGFRGGVYAAWGWDGYAGSGTHFADKVHTELKRVWPQATAGFPKVQFNDELHDPLRIEQLLRRWRELRPFTDTSWTLEGMQGGWFTPSLVQAVIDTRTRVVPQCYTGPMLSTDALAAVRDLTKRGIPDAMISPMYDAKTAETPFQEGWFFTMGRLPA